MKNGSSIRMSEPFRKTHTLMVYHWMFPRHLEDKRPGPSTPGFLPEQGEAPDGRTALTSEIST